MIVWSPFIMDELAGLRDSVPVTAFGDPKSDELARRTGFLTELSGPSNASGAGWMDMRYMGITVDASVNAAKEFTEYSMNEGYLDTLGIAPEGKFPVRSGTPENPQQFIEGWKELQFGVDRQAAPGEVYPDDVVNQMLQGLETGSRWGFKKGQGSLTSKLYETRVYAELVREYIDGQRSAEATAELMQQETEELLNQ
jgi:multiple sugar transport system substrate-binding protein